MVSKPQIDYNLTFFGFRAVLFRMVSKLGNTSATVSGCFRAVLFRMVLKYTYDIFGNVF